MSSRMLRAKQYAGTVDANGVKISPGKLIHRLIVKNTNDAMDPDLLLSLDGGRTYHPISPQETFDASVLLHFFYLAGASGDADYSVVAFCG